MTAFGEVDLVRLRAQGYCRLGGLVDAALREVFEELRAVGAFECRKHALTLGIDEPIAAALRLGGAYRVGLFTKLKQLVVIHDMVSAIVSRLRKEAVLSRLGIAVPALHATLKGDLPGDDAFLFPWHQDYRMTRSHRSYRLWVPLRPVNAIDGGMEMAAGSLGDHFEYAGEKGSYEYIPGERIEGRYATEVLDLPAGDGVLFDPRVVHRSIAGHGPRMRFVLILHIEDATALMNPFDPGDPLAQFVAVAADA